MKKVSCEELAQLFGVSRQDALVAMFTLYDRRLAEIFLQSDTGAENPVIKGFPEGTSFEVYIQLNQQETNE